MSSKPSVKESDFFAISKRMVALPADKRTVFEQALKTKGINFWALPIAPRPRTSESFPLSFSQERLWVLDQLESESSRYNLFFGIRFFGRLNLNALERSVNEIVRRHEVLRTNIVSVDGHGHQLIRAFSPITLPLMDVNQYNGSDREELLKDLAKTQASTSFNLQHEPVVRAQLVRYQETEHILMATIHHLVFDAWSVALITSELSTLYAEFVQGKPSSLVSLPIQYVDYSCWQREWLQSLECEAQWTYWKKQLQNPILPVMVPFDRTPSSVRSFEGAAESLTLSEALSNQIYALCRCSGVTLYMLMLAVYQLMLSRYSGHDDICVGTSIANRSRPETERLIGFLVNTLVMRTNLSGDLSFFELLSRVRDVVSGALAHQDLPFEKLMELLEVPRELNVNPLFQVFFVLENVPKEDLQIVGVALEPFEVEGRLVHFDLTLRIGEEEEHKHIHCQLEYAKELFEPSTVAQLLKHYHSLLEAAVAYPEARISELAMRSKAERHQLLVESNNTQVDYPRDLCIHELVQSQVQKQPDVLAVQYEDKALTYREVEARANQLAHYLQTLGVGPDVRVGLCLERSLDLIVGLLAVLKAGGAYVPLVPTLPQERLQYLLRDSRAHIVLTQTQWSAVFADTGLSCVCLDREWPEILALSEQPVDSAVRPDNLAYVIYTSGSTGQPKGVGVEHRQLVNYLHGLWVRVPLSVDASSAMLSTVAADLGHTAIFGALCSGRPLHVLSTERGFDPNAMAEYMQTHAIDVLKVTPSHLLGLLEATQPEQVLPRQCLILGGEAVPPSLLERIRALNPSCTIINHYGPTETTVGVLTHPVTTDDDKRARVPIGRPLANTQAYILDHTFEPTPIGIPGELYIGGQGVARGYLERPALTAARFLPDPFSQQRGGRLYRTGDRARYLADGTIEFLGRVDNQVKVRGFRIELGEIEAQLRGEAGVTDAVVVVREHATGGSQLVAYVVGAPGAKIDVQEVRQQLAQRLPDYMVPSAILRLDAFPLTPNGKVDRTALPDSDASDEEATTYAGPSNSAEATLVKIWTEVLRREPIGIHDNFFELGGDSILTLQVIARAHRQGLKLTPKQLFEWPTVAQLAAAVPSSDEQIVVPPNGIPADSDSITPAMLPLVTLTPDQIALIVQAVPGGARNVQDIYPLAPLQEGLFFHHLLSPDNDPYVLSTLLGFDTRERMDGFLSALKAVIARHDILRTAIWWEGLTEPVQVVWREAPVLVEETHLGADEAVLAEQLCGDEGPRHYRFDIRQAPLLRVWSARNASNGQWQLQLFWHHLIGDHVTMALLTEEIQMIQQGEQDRLQPPVPFRNFVATARQGRDVAGEEAFFTKMLGDVVVPTAPFGLQSLQGDAWELEAVQQSVAVRLAQRVRQCARRLGVSAASLLHLAWAQVLARITGQADVVFGTVLLGRMHASGGVERMPGLFMNTLPVRVSVDEQSVAQSVRKTHECVTQLLQHEHASLALAQRCSGVDAQVPLFTTLLNYRHNQPRARTDKSLVDHEIQGEGEGLDVLGGTARTHYAVSLDVDDDGKSLTLTAQVAIPGQAHRLCEYMQTGLGNLVEALESAPETPVKLIDVVPDGERAQLLTDWNATEQVWGEKAQNVVEVFEAQVTQTPEAVAVVCGEECVTYAALNAQANQVAQVLVAEGVGPERLVGVLHNRDTNLLAMLLGVWKAGGAYLPLDPTYPDPRLLQIITQSRTAIVLTTEALARRVRAAGGELVAGPLPGLLTMEAIRTRSEDMTDSWPRWLPEQLAYVLYTSGSTGVPKGAMVTHAGLMNHLLSKIHLLTMTARDRLAQTASQAFDISVWQLVTPLLCGGQAHIIPDVVAHDLEALVGALDGAGMTIWEPVPAMLQGVLEVGERSGKPRPTFANLRWVLPTGEALLTEVCRQWFRQYPTIPLCNAYGPAECADDVAMHAFTELSAADEGAVPIGRPVPNLCLYVLSPDRQVVPVGVVGEVCVAGVGVGRGYLHEPAQTAGTFLPNPFSPEGGERLYSTGDLGRYRPDGTLEFVGRRDHQVKVRGYRIELGEIEAHLLREPSVREAVVVIQEEGPGGPRLEAYYSVHEGEVGPTSAVWRQWCQERLPVYMVPSVFVELTALPRTSNGKVDRQALPVPDVSGDIAGQYVAPRTPTEELLAGIWADLLNVERVGIHDNFFDLGGHSLLAVQASTCIQKMTGYSLSLQTFFKTPTVASLAEVFTNELCDTSSSLITFQSDGTCPPLYCLDPTGTHVLAYQPLAKSLGVEQPVYGITLNQMFSLSRQEVAVENIAREHVRLIQERQPEGPYNVIGWSNGGLIALAVAHVLEEQGQSIAFLGILDTQMTVETHLNENLITVDELLAYLDIAGKQKYAVLPEVERVHFQESLQQQPDVGSQIELTVQWAKERGILSKTESDVSIQIFQFVHALRKDAACLMHEYQRNKVQTPIHVWWASETVKKFGKAPIDWTLYTTGEVKTETIEGTHKDVVESPIVHQRIAETLKRLHSLRSDSSLMNVSEAGS
ncbi:amino acid adenylation domain-containing protein [Nitrospira sp. M1]